MKEGMRVVQACALSTLLRDTKCSQLAVAEETKENQAETIRGLRPLNTWTGRHHVKVKATCLIKDKIQLG